MTPVQAVFFDLDGTLINDDASSRFCAEATCRHFESALGGIDPAVVAEARLRIGKAFWNHRAIAGSINDRELRTKLWAEALQECGIAAAGLADQFAVLYSALREKAVMPYDDALPVVEALVDRGYTLAVITNGPSATQRSKLELAGLDGYFDAFIASSDIGAGKPEIVVFEAALKAVRCDPRETWHVGDNLATDVAGAINAGIRAAWLNRPGELRPLEHAEPHAELRTLWELPSVLPGRTA